MRKLFTSSSSLKRYYSNGATKEGTKKYFDKFNHLQPKLLKTEWSVSPVGYSGYSLSSFESEYQYSLQYAIQGGCNLIDTSPNYQFGDSENVIGIVLNGMISDKLINRNEIIISTKVGYFNTNEEDGEELEFEDEEIIKNYKMKKIGNKVYHSLNLDYISYSIGESLRRLNLSQIDVLFLQILGDEEQEKMNEIYEHLELEVKKKRIQYYGISFNKSIKRKFIEGFTNIESPLPPHFKFIQVPFNLIENESMGYFEELKRIGLNIFTTRPFYCSNDKIPILKLTLNDHYDSIEIENDKLNNILKQFQKISRETLTIELNFESVSEGYQLNELPPIESFKNVQILSSNLNNIGNITMLNKILVNQIHPNITNAYYKLCELKDEKIVSWYSSYRFYLNQYFDVLKQLFEQKHLIEMMELNQKLKSPHDKLSNKLIHYYSSIEEIDSILVGMNKRVYVKDIILNLNKFDKIKDIKNIFKEVSGDGIYQEIKFIEPKEEN